MSGRSTPWRTMPRGEQRFRVGVTSTGRWLVHRKVNWSRAPRIFALSRRSWCRREHTKGPCSRKVSRFASRRLLFTRRRRQRARSSSSVSSCTASTEWSVVQRGSGEGRTPSDRRRSTTGTSEVRSRCRRGKKTPTPRGSPVRRFLEDLRSSTDPPKRSSWRETTVYLGSSQEAARRAPEPGARNPENTRDAGFRLDSLDGRSRSVTSWQETPSAKAGGNEPV
jgi:hypothetical protein